MHAVGLRIHIVLAATLVLGTIPANTELIIPDMIEIQIGLRRRQRGKSYYTNQGIALALIVKMIEPLILLQQKMNVG